ncbi:MAG: class I SAM-dependent methyltransferase [Candidatus Aminicenantes bacterium]|nr:MAG: class I SAM-dependent methyltransferase [Candidatus Aminicenantes bacterium]
MRRIIEELIEKRKQQQTKLKKILEELGQLIEYKRFFNKKKKKGIKEKLLEFNQGLNDLITIQDKEWDAYSNNHSTMVFKSLQWKIEKLEAEYSNVKTLLANFIGIEKSLQRLIASIDEKAGDQAKAETISQLERMKEQLSPYQYSDFEQRFRGDEKTVKEKLKIYLPIFAHSDHVLDIGCGRGEFLELLQEQGKQGQGIDISESLLAIARDKGLTCQKSDALQYLKQQSAGSIAGIFSAQVIEHLQPEYLRELVIESFRVLKRNSPILLETVNPLSIFALSNIYFLDVTHQKPLHPEFMRYLLESSGFSEVNIIYPEELTGERLEDISPENSLAREFNTNVDKLNKLLYASPVYAVTGTKK